ncbi:MAG: indole-3-glycerol-phosphate synthase [bacterium]|nr:indole-3-glycerol-phosphate synthase [bacterium]
MKQKNMHNILLDIIKKKKKDLNNLKSENAFKKAILNPQYSKIAYIGEIKLTSPTMNIRYSKNNIVERALEYKKAGLDAISIITEKHYFKGNPLFIPKIKKKVTLPILQKDFVIDKSQIYEAKSIQSDALLLIARLVNEQTLKHFVNVCRKLEIEPVVEINNDKDLKKTLSTSTSIIAVNSRNLETFEININKACKLLKKIPNKYIKLGFSGINSSKEVKKYKTAGAQGVLIGTSLMKTNNIPLFINSLRARSLIA